MALSLVDVHFPLQSFTLVFLNNTLNNVASPVMWPFPMIMLFAEPILHGERISMTDGENALSLLILAVLIGVDGLVVLLVAGHWILVKK